MKQLVAQALKLKTASPSDDSSVSITSEQLFFDNKDFFSAFCQALAKARTSIDLETYIFADDSIGTVVLEHLIAAAERGVQVRLIVDGIGSLEWLRKLELKFPDNINVRIFHPVPFVSRYIKEELRLRTLPDTLIKLNRRTHKKLLIVDGQVAFLGSHNIWDASLQWLELSVRLAPCYDKLKQSFEYSWTRSKSRPNLSLNFNKLRYDFRRDDDSVILLNFKRRERYKHLRAFQQRIAQAERRVWLLTPYFVPPMQFLRTLCQAADQGKDVRIILPKVSDVKFMRFAAHYFYPYLLRRGVKIYEYGPEVLHAKAMIVDDWALIGSANLNHRSFLYDLEIMLVLNSETAKNELESFFNENFIATPVITQNSNYVFPWWKKALARILLSLRNWM